MEWISVKDKEPPKDGSYFLSGAGLFYQQTRWGTFHPNAQGVETWRDPQGHKVKFTHWRLQPPPKEK